MADLEATPLFRPSPFGFNYIQQWGDLTNDGGSQTRDLYYRNGSAFLSAATGSGNWVRAARSVATITAPFTICLEGLFSQAAYIGLNTQGNAPTNPTPRYSRAKYAVRSQSQALIAQVSTIIESGTFVGYLKTWGSNEAMPMIAICDTGAAVKYAFSLDGGGTWSAPVTSAAVYVLGQVFHVDVGTIWGSQPIMVQVHPTALF